MKATLIALVLTLCAAPAYAEKHYYGRAFQMVDHHAALMVVMTNADAPADQCGGADWYSKAHIYATSKTLYPDILPYDDHACWYRNRAGDAIIIGRTPDGKAFDLYIEAQWIILE